MYAPAESSMQPPIAIPLRSEDSQINDLGNLEAQVNTSQTYLHSTSIQEEDVDVDFSQILMKDTEAVCNLSQH